MDPRGLGRALWRLALVAFLTAIGPVTFDTHLVGFLVPTTGSFREELKGGAAAGACCFLRPIRLRRSGGVVLWRCLLLNEGGDS